ncbi:MAG: hypothetical protein ACOYUK_01240 [Patescibacteria group bacterium]
MKQLLVFMGKPGAGKTTLIHELFPGQMIFDVADFIAAYRTGTTWPEHKTLQGYEDMYMALEHMQDVVILELGTNHAEYNINQLRQIRQHADVRVFVCTASVDTLRQRVLRRPGFRDMESIERRFAWDFPNSHLPLFTQAGIEPYFLDMEQPMTDNVILVRQALRS